MSEAKQRAIQYMFEEQNLHRIMANYMPPIQEVPSFYKILDS